MERVGVCLSEGPREPLPPPVSVHKCASAPRFLMDTRPHAGPRAWGTCAPCWGLCAQFFYVSWAWVRTERSCLRLSLSLALGPALRLSCFAFKYRREQREGNSMCPKPLRMVLTFSFWLFTHQDICYKSYCLPHSKCNIMLKVEGR